MDIGLLYEKFLESGHVSTDTRQVKPGSLFFALKGPRFDANQFAEEAIRRGARYAVVDQAEYAKGEAYLLVEDSLDALQQLAHYHRGKLKIPVIGLTGSNGKTTTKELIYAVLSRKFRTHATTGNLNNHIGVPLTVLAIDSTVEVAIVEMGANHVGEIASLAKIADPTHGVITNIGKGHIGTFGGFENVIRGKSELYQHLISRQGIAFINSQNPLLANMAKRFASPVFYPAKGDYYHCEFLDANPFIRLRTENGETLATHLVGSYNFENIAAALCVGKYFGVDEGSANAAVGCYVPGNMRSQVVQKGSNMIILDAYNANPSSMEAALSTLAAINARHKVAILGDMYELGNDSHAEHQRLGKLLSDYNIREAYLCGSHIEAALATFPSARYFPTKEDLVDRLKSHPIHDATILVKASRGMGLETIVEAL